MIGVYYRVSTDAQDFDAQRHAVETWLRARGTDPGAVRVYQDVASGKRDDRPEFARLCKDARDGVIQSICVFRLDRISRTATTALRTIIEWLQLDVEFFAVDQPVLMLGKDNPMRLTVAALFSELAALEHAAIVSRVRSGLAAARARGVRLGKVPSLTAAQVVTLRAQAATGQRVQALAKQYGVSKATVYRYINKAGGNDVLQLAAEVSE